MAVRGERNNVSGATIARYRSYADVYRSRTWKPILGNCLASVWMPGNARYAKLQRAT
jgi:hypothetical protein